MIRHAALHERHRINFEKTALRVETPKEARLVPRATVVLSLTAGVWADDKVNYQDHTLPIFRDACLNCHNPDKKKSGLDLSSWQTAMNGSNDGAVINPGDPDGSILYRVMTHQDEPSMPPKREKLPESSSKSSRDGSWAAHCRPPTENRRLQKAKGGPDL